MNKQRFKYLKFSDGPFFLIHCIEKPFEDVTGGIITFFPCLFKTKRIEKWTSEIHKQRFKYLKFFDGPFFILDCFETTIWRCHWNNYIFSCLFKTKRSETWTSETHKQKKYSSRDTVPLNTWNFPSSDGPLISVLMSTRGLSPVPSILQLKVCKIKRIFPSYL